MVERNKSKVLGKRHFSAIRYRTTVQHHAPLCKVHGDTTTENYETFIDLTNVLRPQGRLPVAPIRPR
jgi:hypothetical protein